METGELTGFLMCRRDVYTAYKPTLDRMYEDNAAKVHERTKL